MSPNGGPEACTFLPPGPFLLSQAALGAKMPPKALRKSPRDQSKPQFSPILGRFGLDFLVILGRRFTARWWEGRRQVDTLGEFVARIQSLETRLWTSETGLQTLEARFRLQELGFQVLSPWCQGVRGS